ncbi:DEAD/DEAH box helicase [Belliella pelovolcani]|uniref:Superfamily II DNA or RNA helicase, SNF2 family n=1 Tax=Belliella pelovolcani TaxID=529505 RepID=A0A1N7KFG5_9BACT|nr:SNF2-related protein [Belliella pelovolcani]SIS60230.1 Superfamily II DNA or RNA helicase, SNF2 family [Belliella pelovolcani]
MKVSAEQPFEIVYSLFSHEFLGLLFESFVIQLDEKGRLSLANQNISSVNAKEFAAGLDETDYQLIKMMDEMQQDAITKKLNTKKLKAKEYLRKIYDPKTGNKAAQEMLELKLEGLRSKILPKLKGKRLFEMANDGNPIWKEICVMPEPATVLFHFRRNEENTHYFPTLKYRGEKLEWQYKNAYLVCHEPAWLVADGALYHFAKGVDGKKLSPFLNKKFIVIPKKVEQQYYEKFVTQLVASFDVYAKGFEIKVERNIPEPVLSLSDLPGSPSIDLFGNKEGDGDEDKIVFDLKFQYGNYAFRSDDTAPNNVKLEQNGDDYTFYKVVRDGVREKSYGDYLKDLGLPVRSSRFALEKSKAFGWINSNREKLEEQGIRIQQATNGKGKKYFIGHAEISVEVTENIDWFDVNALIKFGSYKIPFAKIRKLLLQGKSEFELPNGEIAVIPDSWFVNYTEIFAFLEDNEKIQEEALMLKKHHIALAQELQSNNLVQLTMSRKLEKLRDFSQIEDFDLPSTFHGELRPYQKAGYNWLRFLNEYRFGGCLADDMGLGKTVQTLALLAHEKEVNPGATSLLVMPTSLIYNWELEARKFTPGLKVLVYTGTQRIKDNTRFAKYDLVLTSYGITRLDVDIFKGFYFNYVILDESQAIKNPGSIIAKAVNELNCRHKLILTGTPVENGTMDLWSQMNFINTGLLGNQNMFKKQFLLPIEKKNDMDKAAKLHAMIKPFIMRRLKTQVATDLPEKVINVKYSSMTESQEKAYEEIKSYYREKIVSELSVPGLKNQQFTLLRGLTQLRQIANHPRLTNKDYVGDSGKLEDVIHMLHETASEGHKVLVFSQFVRHLGIVREFLDQEGIKYAYLDGSTKDRQAQVKSFQEDESVKIFLISLKAGGVGLNLTKAEYVFLLDPWWNPAVEAQAIDRAHRIGQENKVIIYKFITRNSVEEKIMALQERKMALAGELISTEESFMKSLNKEDIEALLA